jgi:predicted NBD/HSP70 family sugar kinase
MPVRIGIDLGGTKIEFAALDDDNAVLFRRRVATPAGDYNATVDTIVQLVREADHELRTIAPVGIGTPGAPSRETGLMKNANSTVLIGKPLKSDIEAKIGREVRMTNDANCFALSESFDGAARDAHVVFGAILGTGVGGGIAVGRHIIEGPNAIAGEWGHNPLPWPRADEMPGPRCYCGKDGCIETFCSGPALTREYRQLNAEVLAPTQIAAREAEGQPAAEQCIATYFDRLARALAGVINVLDPDVIVFGGGVSNIRGIYSRLPLLLREYVFSDSVRTRLVQAQHGDSSGVRGAAMLWQ